MKCDSLVHKVLITPNHTHVFIYTYTCIYIRIAIVTNLFILPQGFVGQGNNARKHPSVGAKPSIIVTEQQQQQQPNNQSNYTCSPSTTSTTTTTQTTFGIDGPSKCGRWEHCSAHRQRSGANTWTLSKNYIYIPSCLYCVAILESETTGWHMKGIREYVCACDNVWVHRQSNLIAAASKYLYRERAANNAMKGRFEYPIILLFHSEHW